MSTPLDLTDAAGMHRFCFHVGALNRALNHGRESPEQPRSYRSPSEARAILRLALLGAIVDPAGLPPAMRAALQKWEPTDGELHAYSVGYRAGIPVIGSDADRTEHTRSVLREELPAVQSALEQAIASLRRAVTLQSAVSAGLGVKDLDWFATLSHAAMTALVTLLARTEKTAKALSARPRRSARTAAKSADAAPTSEDTSENLLDDEANE